MSYILVKNSDQTVISPIAAHESAGTGETKRELADTFSGSIYIGGRVSLTAGKVSAISDPNPTSSAASRREEVRRWLRAAEREPIANWSLNRGSSNDHRDRARNTWWWLEMICVAAQTDGNLTDATKWGLIENEMEDWTIRKWYDDHIIADWRTFVSRAPTAFYATTSSGASSGQGMTMKSNAQTLAEFLA